MTDLVVTGVHARDIFCCLAEDEKVGARVVEYGRGNLIVYAARPLPQNKILRWLVARDWWTQEWAVQANYIDGSCMGTSVSSRAEAIKIGKQWIDRRKVK